MLFAHPLAGLSHFCGYGQANWALLVLIPGWVGLCTFLDPVGLSNELSCEAWSFSSHHNPHMFLSPEVLRLYFPALEPWVAWSVLLLSCSSPLAPHPHANVGLSGPPATTLPCILSTRAAPLIPSYQSG